MPGERETLTIVRQMGEPAWISGLSGPEMTRTKLFQSNGLQALRLPQGVAFPADVRQVAIIRDGARRVIVPAESVWDDFFAAPGMDIGEGAQPMYQKREPF